MLLRDGLKDEEYFKNRYLKDTNNVIESNNMYIECMDKLKYPNADIRACLRSIYIDTYHKLISGYSLGITCHSLSKEAESIVDIICKTWDSENEVYGDIEKAYYLIIIFKMAKERINKIELILKATTCRDMYLDLLANLVNPDWTIKSETILWPKNTKPLADIIHMAKRGQPENSVARLKKYLEKEWFKTLTEGMITNHDHLSNMQYRGYWCIEAAALVKALNLDDSELVHCKYYPVDMAYF